jgi:hypothetical protein
MERGPGPAVQLEPEVLALPPHRLDAPPVEARADIRWRSTAEHEGIGAGRHALEAPPAQARLG